MLDINRRHDSEISLWSTSGLCTSSPSLYSLSRRPYGPAKTPPCDATWAAYTAQVVPAALGKRITSSPSWPSSWYIFRYEYRGICNQLVTWEKGVSQSDHITPILLYIAIAQNWWQFSCDSQNTEREPSMAAAQRNRNCKKHKFHAWHNSDLKDRS